MAIISEQPVLSRLDRLDNMLRQLEELRGCNSNRSSCASRTPSSGTLTPSVDLCTPTLRSLALEKHCRPIDHVMVETEVKGTVIERLDQVEDRLIKLCLQLEEELEAEKKREENAQKKGIKQLVKRCVKGKQTRRPEFKKPM